MSLAAAAESISADAAFKSVRSDVIAFSFENNEGSQARQNMFCLFSLMTSNGV